jgi:hypothetical protein
MARQRMRLGCKNGAAGAEKLGLGEFFRRLSGEKLVAAFPDPEANLLLDRETCRGIAGEP